MISRQRLSTVLFFISGILILYPMWFNIKYSTIVIGLSWVCLSISRSLLLFPKIQWDKGEVKIGKEIKQ